MKYQALADAIERDVASGRLNPGQRLPTHRELAEAMGMNVSTVTRGYREAEKRGLVAGTVGRGTFVSSDAATDSFMAGPETGLPGMLEMGIIEPLYQLDPDIAEGMARVLRRRNPEAFLRYTSPQGLPEHRAVGAEWAGRYGMAAKAENVIVCAGAQHALSCVMTSLFKPGERMATDALTYPGIKSVANLLGLRLAPIEMDDEGMVPQSLDAACRRNEIKAVYLIPGIHNPTALCMPDSRRDAIAQVAATHGLTIIEDDAYNLSLPEDTTPVSARLPESSVYVAGLSKAVAAGLRVAFVSAPPAMRRPLTEAVHASMWMVPPLNVELACMWIREGTADKAIVAKRAEAATRHAIAARELAPLDISPNPHAFFIWLALPESWTGADFEIRARQSGINIFSAEKFTVGDAPAPQAARIALSAPGSHGQLGTALGTLSNILHHRLPDPVIG